MTDKESSLILNNHRKVFEASWACARTVVLSDWPGTGASANTCLWM